MDTPQSAQCHGLGPTAQIYWDMTGAIGPPGRNLDEITAAVEDIVMLAWKDFTTAKELIVVLRNEKQIQFSFYAIINL